MQGSAITLGGKVIVVCGAGGAGISAATTLAVGASGAQVVAVDHTAERVSDISSQVETAGGLCSGVVADLKDPAQSRRIVDKVISDFGRLDAVVNVAGGTVPGQWCHLEHMSDEVLRDIFALNFDYVARICRDAARWMIDNGVQGSFVNIASISALAGAPYHGHYGAAKAGVVALTRTMALEWNRHGIRANTISPGAVPSARTQNLIEKTMNPSNPNLRQGQGSGIMETADTDPRGRRAVLPEEIAKAAIFLLSDLASGVNGHNLVVDAGLTANFAAGDTTAMHRLVIADSES